MEVKRLRLISIGFVAVAVIFLSISIGTNSWYVNKDIEGKVLYEMGLWKICVYGGSGEPCTSWEQNKATDLGVLMHWPGWLHITKAFAFFAVFAGLLAMVGSISAITCQDRCKIISQCSTLLMSISCFIAFGVFVSHIQEDRPLTTYGSSFILFTLASLMSIVAAALDMAANCRSSTKTRNFRS